MGQSRQLHPPVTGLPVLIGLLLALGGCGGDDAGLLATADLEEIYAGGAGGSGYSVSSRDPAAFGTISGKVTYAGRKRRKRIQLASGFCTNAHGDGMLSEDFLVGDQGELGGVIVYLKRGLSRVSFPVPDEPVVLDQKGCRYIPHLSVLQIGQALVVKSSDNEPHNVHGMPGGKNKEFNVPMTGTGVLAPRYLDKTQVCLEIKCEIHGWMQSWVAVLPHPCWAITKADGTFRIEGVPPGTLQLAFWHEKLGEHVVDIKLDSNEQKTGMDHRYEAR